MSDTPFPPSPDEAIARARDRIAAVGSIASLVSHEVRNRLATVRAALELLEAGMERHLPPEHRTMLLREFDAFIGDFNLGVDMLRGNLGAAETLSARETIGSALESFGPPAGRRGVLLAPRYGHARDGIRADRRLLRLVILNLIRNSLQALAETAAPRIEVRTADEPDRLRIEVADNGPGVNPRVLKDLWIDPGRGREDSAGMGLILCRDAMTVMRGSIAYAAPPGGTGACFRLTVPLA